MAEAFSYNDGVLFVSLLYSCVDLGLEWDTFSGCSRPLHQWLLVSYASIIVLRALHLLGAAAATAPGRAAAAGADDVEGGLAGEFLLDLRHKAALPRAAAALTWATGLPFFAAWTALGTAWFWHVAKETPTCVPSVTHLWFSGFWLVLCYGWILVHAALGIIALIMELRLRRAEAALRAVADEDTVRRWGQVGGIEGWQALSGRGAAAPALGGKAGLAPEAILALPLQVAGGQDGRAPCAHGDRECPICISAIEQGDVVRSLPGCGHTFHRSCIDLWLLRRADCPLCKRSVGGGAAEDGAQEEKEDLV